MLYTHIHAHVHTHTTRTTQHNTQHKHTHIHTQVWDLGNVLEAAAAASSPEGGEATKKSKKSKTNDQQVKGVCFKCMRAYVCSCCECYPATSVRQGCCRVSLIEYEAVPNAQMSLLLPTAFLILIHLNPTRVCVLSARACACLAQKHTPFCRPCALAV